MPKPAGNRDAHEKRRPHRSCKLCQDRVATLDYKEGPLLRRYLDENGKILSRSVSGNCAEHQRLVSIAVKRSREIGIS